MWQTYYPSWALLLPHVLFWDARRMRLLWPPIVRHQLFPGKMLASLVKQQTRTVTARSHYIFLHALTSYSYPLPGSTHHDALPHLMFIRGNRSTGDQQHFSEVDQANRPLSCPGPFSRTPTHPEDLCNTSLFDLLCKWPPLTGPWLDPKMLICGHHVVGAIWPQRELYLSSHHWPGMPIHQEIGHIPRASEAAHVAAPMRAANGQHSDLGGISLTHQWWIIHMLFENRRLQPSYPYLRSLTNTMASFSLLWPRQNQLLSSERLLSRSTLGRCGWNPHVTAAGAHSRMLWHPRFPSRSPHSRGPYRLDT